MKQLILNSADLTFIVRVVVYSILLSSVLLIVSLIVEAIRWRQHSPQEVRTGRKLRLLQKASISHFAKVTGVGLMVSIPAYFISIALHIERWRTRYFILSLAIICSFIAFFQVLELLLNSRINQATENGPLSREAFTKRVIRIRGRFRDGKQHRIVARVFAVFLGIILPVLLTTIALAIPASVERWLCLLVTVSGIPIGIFFWVSSDREWEFTGKEVIARAGGRTRWTIPFTSITNVEVKPASPGRFWLFLCTPRRRYTVFVLPELANRLLAASQNEI